MTLPLNKFAHFWFVLCAKKPGPLQVALGGEAPLENFSSPLEKRVGQNLKLLDIVQKNLAPLRKLFAPLGVPSWLGA